MISFLPHKFNKFLANYPPSHAADRGEGKNRAMDVLPPWRRHAHRYQRPLHNTPSAASLSRFGLGHVRKHTPFALTLSSLHLGYSAKSLPKKRCFFGERPFCKGLCRGRGARVGRYTSVTAPRMTDAYGASTPEGCTEGPPAPSPALPPPLHLVRQYSVSGEREAPRRGAFFIARASEGRSPDDPGDADGSLFPRPRQGVGRHIELLEGATP